MARDINPALTAKVVADIDHIVTHGILDIHVYVCHRRAPEGLRIDADSHSFRNGVTTMVDCALAHPRSRRA